MFKSITTRSGTLSTKLSKMPLFDLPKVWNAIDDELKK